MPVTTLADQVGHGCFPVKPVFQLMKKRVFEPERLHGDDTTIRILAKGKCTTGRICAYVRDDIPFGGPGKTAAKRRTCAKGRASRCATTCMFGCSASEKRSRAGQRRSLPRPSAIVESARHVTPLRRHADDDTTAGLNDVDPKVWLAQPPCPHR